jgi:hypothetical protein
MMAIPGHVLAGTGLVGRMIQIDTEAAETLVNYQWALAVYPLVLFATLFLFPFLKETYSRAD